MAISHFMPSGPGPRMAARVVTVNNQAQRLELALGDGGMVHVSIGPSGPVFRMPKEGEIWWIRRDGGVWRLDAPLDLATQNRTGSDTGSELVQIANLSPGDIRLDATPSTSGSGVWIGDQQALTGTWQNGVPVFSGEVPSVAADFVWQDWTPTLTGWSSDPIGGIYRYLQFGNFVHVVIRQPNNGTSDSDHTLISAPVAAATIDLMRWDGICWAADNGVDLDGASVARINSGSSDIDFFRDIAGNVHDWTASGGKRIRSCHLIYEAA